MEEAHKAWSQTPEASQALEGGGPQSSSCHAFGDDALGAHDAVGLAHMVANGDVQPTELVEAAIARLERVNPDLNAVAVTDFDRARQRAGAPKAGPFSGVPMAVKDQVMVEGLPTRYGSDGFPNAKPAEKNCPLVDQFQDMGLINLAKTTLPEFGFTCSTEFPAGPPTRNPWNVGRSAGGSSGGSAALVAAGVVPIAMAADGGGSIRIPAACNGLVGLKPTAGRLIHSKLTETQLVPLVCDGVVTRSVRDTATWLAESELRHRNKDLPEVGRVERPVDRRLRVLAVDASPLAPSLDGPTHKTFAQTIELLEGLGHAVEQGEVPIGQQLITDFKAYWAFLGFCSLNLSRIAFGQSIDKTLAAEFTRGLGRVGRSNLFRIPGAVRRLRHAYEDLLPAVEGYDVVLTPTVSTITPEIGYLGMDQPYEELFPRVLEFSAFTPLFNATGAPSISLPLGFHQPTNLPIGMMFSALRGQERLLLELGLQLEEAKPFTHLCHYG